MLVRFECTEWNSHDHVLIEMAVGASKHATLGMVSVPCPDCGRKTRAQVVG